MLAIMDWLRRLVGVSDAGIIERNAKEVTNQSSANSSATKGKDGFTEAGVGVWEGLRGGLHLPTLLKHAGEGRW